jgi:hypothetical protein
LYGDEDTVVPFEQSEILIEVLMKIGVEAELHKLEGAGHRSQEFVQPEVQRTILAFLDRHLKHTCNSRKIESQNDGENSTLIWISPSFFRQANHEWRDQTLIQIV